MPEKSGSRKVWLAGIALLALAGAGGLYWRKHPHAATPARVQQDAPAAADVARAGDRVKGSANPASLPEPAPGAARNPTNGSASSGPESTRGAGGAAPGRGARKDPGGRGPADAQDVREGHGGEGAVWTGAEGVLQPHERPGLEVKNRAGQEIRVLSSLADILPLNRHLDPAQPRSWYEVPGKLLAEGRGTEPTPRLKLTEFKIERIELGAEVRVALGAEVPTRPFAYRIKVVGGEDVRPRAMPAFIWIGRHVLRHTRVGERWAAAIFFDSTPVQPGLRVGVSFTGALDPACVDWLPPVVLKSEPEGARQPQENGPDPGAHGF